MANIGVTDQAQASASFDVSDTSPLSLAKLRTLRFSSLPIVSDFAKPMDEFPLDKVAVGLGLEAPSLLIGSSGVLQMDMGVNANLTLRTVKQKTLFDDDLFAPPVPIGLGQCWAGLCLKATVAGSIGAVAPSGFGVFTKFGTSVAFSCWVRFPRPGGSIPLFKQGLKITLESYSVPTTAEQLRGISEGIAHTTEISGSVSLGAFFAIPLALNPLATVELPFNLKLDAVAGAIASLNASVTLEGDFIVRFFKSGTNELIIGLYKKQESILTASIGVAAGMEVVSGGTDQSILTSEIAQTPGVQSGWSDPDILGKVLGVLFPAPKLDDLHLDPEQMRDLNASLKQSVEHSLSVAVNTCCTASNADEAAVIYKVDLSKGNAAATDDALNAALHGDWSRLEQLENAVQLRHVLRVLNDRQFKTNINFLGIYNAVSISDYLKSSTVVVDEDGQVSMLDRASAESVSAGTTPLAAKSDRLRFLLAQAFVATVTYGACKGKAGITEFNVRQTFLEYHDRASVPELNRQISLLRFFGFELNAELDSIVKAKMPMKHNRLYLDTKYNLPAVYRLFYQDAENRQAYSMETIDRAGRNARIAILDPTAPNSMQRRTALSNDETWKTMNDCGNVALFKTLPGLAKLSLPAIQAIGADWTDIRWWSDALQGITPHLTAVLEAVSESKSGDPTQNAKLESAHQGLNQALKNLTSKTHSAFGDGWPVAVMYSLAQQSGDADSVEVEAEISLDGKFQQQVSNPELSKSKSISA